MLNPPKRVMTIIKGAARRNGKGLIQVRKNTNKRLRMNLLLLLLKRLGLKSLVRKFHLKKKNSTKDLIYSQTKFAKIKN